MVGFTRDELTTILNGHSNGLPSNSQLSNHGLVQLSQLIIEVSLWFT